MTRKRTRPFKVKYCGQDRTFPPDATDEDVARWKNSIREWVNAPEALKGELNGMVRRVEVSRLEARSQARAVARARVAPPLPSPVLPPLVSIPDTPDVRKLDWIVNGGESD
jgi:hypothetical protein